jgi:flagellar biogenesis protein FliO
LKNGTPTRKEKWDEFWKRQFSYEITPAQKTFDVMFGAVIPIVLLTFDPLIFRVRNCLGRPVLADHAIFAYLAITIGMLYLLIWLVRRKSSARLNAFFAGIFTAGGLFALALGIFMLQMSIPGLILYGLGILGFVPFVVSFIYFRNAIRARRMALFVAKEVSKTKAPVSTVMVLAAVLVLGVPALTQYQMKTTIQNAVNDLAETPSQPDKTTYAISQLKIVYSLCSGVCLTTLNDTFNNAIAQHRDQGVELEDAFQAVTGYSIQSYQCSAE